MGDASRALRYVQRLDPSTSIAFMIQYAVPFLRFDPPLAFSLCIASVPHSHVEIREFVRAMSPCPVWQLRYLEFVTDRGYASLSDWFPLLFELYLEAADDPSHAEKALKLLKSEVRTKCMDSYFAITALIVFALDSLRYRVRIDHLRVARL